MTNQNRRRYIINLSTKVLIAYLSIDYTLSVQHRRYTHTLAYTHAHVYSRCAYVKNNKQLTEMNI